MKHHSLSKVLKRLACVLAALVIALAVAVFALWHNELATLSSLKKLSDRDEAHWAATLIAMKGYTLTGEKMKEIQAVNACRRDAVANGMKLEEAMTKWQSMDQLPAEYRS